MEGKFSHNYRCLSFWQDSYGTLVVAGLIDRELKDSYTLQITATDGGVPISRKVCIYLVTHLSCWIPFLSFLPNINHGSRLGRIIRYIILPELHDFMTRTGSATEMKNVFDVTTWRISLWRHNMADLSLTSQHSGSPSDVTWWLSLWRHNMADLSMTSHHGGYFPGFFSTLTFSFSPINFFSSSLWSCSMSIINYEETFKRS